MNRDQQHKSNIFLAGFMGSGKSTIGPILANTLGFDFADLDKTIEARSGKKISQIFETDGEPAFRTLEHATLKELAARDRCVVSLGGGSLASEENFELVHRAGIIVYIQLSPEEIVQRVHHRTDRPMLQDTAGVNLPLPEMEIRVRDLLQKREVFYSRADIIVPSDRRRVGATVDDIVKRLRGYLRHMP
jgi:shikimate kinase